MGHKNRRRLKHLHCKNLYIQQFIDDYYKRFPHSTCTEKTVPFAVCKLFITSVKPLM